MYPNSNQIRPEDFRYTVSLTAFSASRLHALVTLAWDIRMHNPFALEMQLGLTVFHDLEASLHFTLKSPELMLCTEDHLTLTRLRPPEAGPVMTTSREHAT